ncbi:MAG: outer membrane beta-barrel protein [Bacteroidaceae bacterium]|nr:outer membrane beta-barrel protein [Bacteroidaceae bacterium]
MRKLLTALCMMLVSCACMKAQGKFEIKGTITDKMTKEVVEGATVQLLSLPDSSFVKGAVADQSGAFSVKDLKKAKYVLKVSYIGYTSKFVDVDVASSKSKLVELGVIALSDDANMLGEALVKGTAAKMQVSGDSLVYNASAYRVPEGSTLEALIRLLPGAKVDENGKITINGKEVTKILLNGKEFFLNDMETAMKNIPVDMVEKIKSYERKSDLARITGIDDGEEETVLDLSVKKDMNSGWFGNVTAGGGTEDMYNSRAMINRFNETTKVSLVGNLRNTPNRWGWNNGLRSDKRIGMNFTDTREKLDTEGSVMYRYNGSNVMNESSSENYAAERGRFGESKSISLTSNHSINANAKLEWKPDSMTNILARPNFNFSRNRGAGSSRSGSYDTDPNEKTEDVLGYNESVAEYSMPNSPEPSDSILKHLLDIVVNTNTSRNQSYSSNTGAGLELQYNRKFNNKGRNLTLRVTGNYNEGNSQQISAANITYNSLGTTRLNNRYYKTPSANGNVAAQVTYNEPIADRTYLQFSYRYQYGYSRNDRRAYVYDSDAYRDLSESIENNRYDIDAILRFMEESDYMMRDTTKLSQYSEYRNYNQAISLQFRRVRESYNFSIGLDAYPQHTALDYKYMGKEYPKVTRSVFNMAPRTNMRWNFDKHTNLRIRYQGRTSQPSMTNLLDITDDSNPLRISKGNPNLKPSFSHSVNLNFNTYKPESQFGMWVWSNFNATNNSISNKTTYDPKTAVRTTMPMNINGNWSTGGGGGMNTGLGEKKLFNVGGHVGAGYSHNVGFYNNAAVEDIDDKDIKSITGNTWANGGLSTSFRNDWLNIELNGDVNYGHVRNNVNSDNNQDTYNFSYGGNIQYTMPCGAQISTDMRMSSRRGYSTAAMNTNELLWNASVSYSLLQGKALTLRAEMFDILHQQTNISRSIDAFSRSDSRNNTIYQYAMLSAVYRFSIYGGRNTMGTDKERRD